MEYGNLTRGIGISTRDSASLVPGRNSDPLGEIFLSYMDTHDGLLYSCKPFSLLVCYFCYPIILYCQIRQCLIYSPIQQYRMSQTLKNCISSSLNYFEPTQFLKNAQGSILENSIFFHSTRTSIYKTAACFSQNRLSQTSIKMSVLLPDQAINSKNFPIGQ